MIQNLYCSSTSYAMPFPVAASFKTTPRNGLPFKVCSDALYISLEIFCKTGHMVPVLYCRSYAFGSAISKVGRQRSFRIHFFSSGTAIRVSSSLAPSTNGEAMVVCVACDIGSIRSDKLVKAAV